MTKEKGRRFIKLMAIHHSIKILRCRQCALNVTKTREMLFNAFNMCEPEQKMFDLLYACAVMYSGNFAEMFASAVMRYVFGKDKYGRLSLIHILPTAKPPLLLKIFASRQALPFRESVL